MPKKIFCKIYNNNPVAAKRMFQMFTCYKWF